MTAILGLTACQKQEIETRTDDMPAANVPESDPEESAEDAYKEYACYTEEMENMVDEICEKYGLSKLSNCHLDISYSDICSKTGVGELCLDSENVKNDILCGYLYDDGSFLFEGNITMRGSKVYDAGYQFARSVKGTFNTSYLNLGNFTERNVRKYTTKKGVDVFFLCHADINPSIIAERENSFIVISGLGDLLDVADVNDEGLEMLADAFDFAAIP